MLIREGVILLEYADLVNDACLSIPAYKKAIAGDRITRVQKGGDGHPALIDWSSLPEKYKEMVRHHLKGDPEDLAKAQVVEKHLIINHADDQYLEQFKGSNGLGLSETRRAELKRAAMVMNLVATIDQVTKEGGTQSVVALYGMPVLKLKETILCWVKANKSRLPSKFPTSFARLEARKRAYVAARATGLAGVVTLIHGGQGNANREKLATEEQRKVMLQVCARHQNYSLRRQAADYNVVAKSQGWPLVSPNTVKRFLADGDNGRSATLYAKGIGQYSNEYGIVVHRSRPSQPTYMWVHDGTDYELLYRKEVGGKATHHHRKLVVVVLDPHTWYPVGYAIGDEDTIALAKEAMANAVRHMRELTGTYAIPYQVQSDRLGYKTLGEWYGTMGVKYTPAAAKNSRSKVIEPWFRQHNDTYANRNYNWSGHNITSRKDRQPSPDALNGLRKLMPTEEGVIAQIHEAIAAERADKAEGFQAALRAMPEGKLRTIGREQFLELFGTRHGWTNELTNRGLCPTIDGHETPFNLLTRDFQRHLGTSWQVIYDEQDLSDVLAIARDGSLKYLVPQVRPVPMALEDHTPETRAQLAATEAFKKELSQDAIDKVLGDREQLQLLADQLLLDATLVRQAQKRRPRSDEAVAMSPEEQAVVKNYLMVDGSHKKAVRKAQEQHVPLTEAEIQRRALDQL